MPQIPRQFIDELLNRVDIVDVIGERVPLKKKGSNHSACCPFHNEKTPSFTVSQQKQFYHCFGCGEHGSAISFLMNYDNMHFVDAIETLAASVNLEVPREAVSPEDSKQRDRHKSLYLLMEQCADFYTTQLKQTDSAIAYLKDRGLDGQTAKQFLMGYAPTGWDNLSKVFPSRQQDLLDTGMLIKNDTGRVYDRFRERIMFPIRDRRGRVVAFGGRVTGQDEPKYLNSPETTLYHKGSELYGLFEGRKAAQDAGMMIVVEGYMDVIALAQADINYAVATLGTATNRQHCENIYRAVPEILFCFDGDRAGREAAWRALQAALPCLTDGREASFLFLPDGDDPDSLVSREGKQGFIEQTTQRIPIIDFLFQHLAGDADLSQIGARARLAEQSKPLLNQIPPGIYRELATRQLESLIGVSLSKSQSTTPSEGAGTPRGSPQRYTQRSAPQVNQQSLTTMRRAVLLIVQNPSLVQTLEPEQYDFDASIRGADVLMKLIGLCDANPDITTGHVLEHFRDTKEWSALNKLAVTPYYPDERELDDESAKAEFSHCINELCKQSRQREADKLAPNARIGLLGLRGGPRER